MIKGFLGFFLGVNFANTLLFAVNEATINAVAQFCFLLSINLSWGEVFDGMRKKKNKH